MSLDEWLSIRYRDFYDVPRVMFVLYRGQRYLFESAFDEQLDEYSQTYEVYLLSNDAFSDIDALRDWRDLNRGAQRLCQVPVSGVVFDETKRRQISSRTFELIR